MLCPPHAALFFNDPATTEIYTLSLHDALPIYPTKTIDQVERLTEHTLRHARIHNQLASNPQYAGDRKSTRLNSSHTVISYAVFCLKKKKRARLNELAAHLPQERHERAALAAMN